MEHIENENEATKINIYKSLQELIAFAFHVEVSFFKVKKLRNLQATSTEITNIKELI